MVSYIPILHVCAIPTQRVYRLSDAHACRTKIDSAMELHPSDIKMVAENIEQAGRYAANNMPIGQSNQVV